MDNTWDGCSEDWTFYGSGDNAWAEGESEALEEQYWKDIESSLRSIDRIEQYVLTHKPDYKHWEAFLVYRRKIDVLWKKDFNTSINNYKIDDNNQVYRAIGRTENVN